jgi:hypothetical protein
MRSLGVQHLAVCLHDPRDHVLDHAQRLDRRDVEVGMERDSQPRLQGGGAGVDPVRALGSQDLVAEREAPAANVARQEGRRQPERPHLRDLIVVQDGAVLDAVAMIVARRLLQDRLVGGDRGVDRGVAAGIAADLPSGAVRAPDDRRQLLERDT